MDMNTKTPANPWSRFRQSRIVKAFAILAVSGMAVTACGDGGSGGESGGEIATEGGDQGVEFLTVATGGSSGVYYQVGAAFADLLASELDSDSSVQATGASAENINLLTDGNAEIAFTMGDANVQALEGTGPFEGEPRDGLMAMATLYPNVVHVVATTASGIESIEDLRGRNVAVGDVGSGVELNAQTILAAHDLSYDDIEVDYLSYAEATDQMANGHIEAAFVTAGLPNPALTELATTTDFIVLPITGDAKATLLENDYFLEDVIPAGTYENDEDIETVGIMNHLMLSSELSEDAGYEITQVFFDNLDAIHNSHNAATEITLETATENLTVPLHPGAARYFEEQGSEVPAE